MSVATHLGIKLAEYDARIRTFIPDYEEMLGVAAAAIPRDASLIVDLGTGTGALAARCLKAAPRTRVVGIDADPAMVNVAAQRLGKRASFVKGSFLSVPLPRCDAVTASFALHHVRTLAAKARLYRRIAAALRRGGVLVTVDCHPAGERKLANRQLQAWRSHLEHSYSRSQAAAYLAAWAKEDVYVPLETEVRLMLAGGLRPELLWRKGAFAVVMATR